MKLPPSYQVCGVEISAVGPEAAARLIVDRAARGLGTRTHLCNAFTLSLVDELPELARALQAADLNLPDGTPVAWLGRRLGTQGPVRGPQLVEDVVRLGVDHALGHYFWGGAPGVGELAAATLEARNPGMKTTGVESPPFAELTPELLDDAAARIRASGAQIVWVGLGTPKQDLAVPELARRLPDVVIVPVGAAFDFLAGTATMAPEWMHGSGLEWVHRLAHEPRRLWRRYVIGNPRFLWNVYSYSHGPKARREGQARVPSGQG